MASKVNSLWCTCQAVWSRIKCVKNFYALKARGIDLDSIAAKGIGRVIGAEAEEV